MKAKLKLKLLSDTIIASGTSIKGVVDNDVVYDEFGLPYIPAKRIYGILREIAEELSYYNDELISNEDIILLFGNRGAENSSNFYLSNGYLKDYEKLHSFLSKISYIKELNSFFAPEIILDNFTYIRAQTAMENGVAKEHSLRTSRVLKRGLEFYFDVEFPDNKKDIIDLICKQIRNIGYQRTRGFGEVETTIDVDTVSTTIDTNKIGQYNDEDEVCIDIEYKNIDPIIVNSNFDNTINYINANAIIGYFANKFIKEKKIKNAHKNDIFRNLFLNNNTIFTNLYPVFLNKRNMPTPYSFKVIKNTTKFVNTLGDSNIEEQLTNIGFDFVSIDNNDLYGYNVKKEINYHHKRPEDKSIGHVSKKAKYNDNEGAFYKFESLQKEQIWKGSIIGKWRFLKELTINSNEILKIGKSKKSQYGRVEIVKIKTKKLEENTFVFKKDASIRLTLLSDYVSLLNTNDLLNSFLEDFANVCEIDKEQIQIKDSILKYKKHSGYNSVWKLPKLQIICLSAGSEVIIQNISDKDINIPLKENKLFLGDSIVEGFGEININQIPKNLNLISDTTNDIDISKLLFDKELLKNILIRYIKQDIDKYVLDKNTKSIAKETSKTFIAKLIVKSQGTNDFNAFNNYLSNLTTKKQKDSINKIKGILFWKNNSIDRMKFFDNLTKNILSITNNKKLVDLLKKYNINIEEDILRKNIEDFYKYYIGKILLKIKFEQRQ